MKTSDILTLVRPNIRALCPYSTARDEFQGSIGVFLDANESPYDTGYNRYPDPHQKALKERLGTLKGLPPERIFLGNGSDEAIDLVFRVFCRPGIDNAVAIDPSYGMYRVCADINDVTMREVPLGADFALPLDALLAACDDCTKLLFLCSPNNPTGAAFPVTQLETVLRRFHGIVVLDEAYADFSAVPSLRSRLDEFPNLVILQTLSKAWGLAALRLGLAYADPLIIRLMSMVKYPYNINAATQRIVLEALATSVDERVKAIVAERGRLAAALPRFACVRRVWPSDANFLLVQVDDADRFYAHLLADGIIVRNRTKATGCAGCVRITVGLPEENDKLLKSMEAYEKGDIRR